MMIAQERVISKLCEQSRQLMQHLEQVNENMDQNEPEYVEQIDRLLIEREGTLQEMKTLYKEGGVTWSADEKAMIEQLKIWEHVITDKIAQLYQAFALQLSKLQQGKHMANRYAGYGDVYTDGAYIDKRK
ncbi:hypothetical protein [Caldalkalibacillus mannanilyticus]|uniref:hypothetical protein n=1 Tax=Caldalkalibacillus mannanilyticus TaxID=1418 RepID=UPI000468441C|nr:hypothetical protein [Caldalkalibacillus mannanilyticus]